MNATVRAPEKLDLPPKLKVFISYSRDDLKFADQLDVSLRLLGYDCTLDRHSIVGGEHWQPRLATLIREADTVVFILSPGSAVSDICGWEVDEASRLGKRILPVVCRPLEKAQPPTQLRNLNYIFFCDDVEAPRSGFGSGLVALDAALDSDLDWIREHTRLLARAMEWDGGGRSKIRLLSGADIGAAKSWAANRPKNSPAPTSLQLDFITASERAEEARLNSERQQLEEMAAAQAQRADALNRMELALRDAASAQRLRARIRNIALTAVTVVAGLAAWQWYRAELRQQSAGALLNSATDVALI